MEKKNNEPKQYYINLKVEREQDLYNPFDPEKNLSEDVKGYIMNKLSNKHGHSAVLFTIITTVGTFSIWEGGNIWIMAGPELRLQQMIFKRLIKSADIEFISEDTLEKDQAHSREGVPL